MENTPFRHAPFLLNSENSTNPLFRKPRADYNQHFLALRHCLDVICSRVALISLHTVSPVFTIPLIRNHCRMMDPQRLLLLPFSALLSVIFGSRKHERIKCLLLAEIQLPIILRTVTAFGEHFEIILCQIIPVFL